MNLHLINKAWILLLFFSLWPKLELWANRAQERYLKEQIQHRPFDEEKMRQASQGIDFTEAKKEIEKRKDIPEGSYTLQNPVDSAFWSAFFKVFLFIAGVVVLGLLLYHFLGAGQFFRPRSKKIKPMTGPINIEAIKEKFHESDLDHYLQEALRQKDFPLVLRLYYLAILKELSLAKQIKWKKDKTNRAYLLEMRQSDQYPAFKKVTRYFERSWYGNSAFDETVYRQVLPDFKKLLNSIKAQSALGAELSV